VDIFWRMLKPKIEAQIAGLGFTRHKMVYIRVINDVCQNFYVERFKRGPNAKVCRIGFSVLPLAQKISREEIENGIGLYYLKKFERPSDGYSEGWIYEIGNESIVACIEEILRYVDSYLIPFFRRAVNTIDAFSELVALEQLFYENRMFYRKECESYNRSSSYAALDLLDGVKYCMALKNHDFDYAWRSGVAILNQNIEAYESVKSFLPPESLSERETDIQRLRKEVKHIENKDGDYFHQLFEKNEFFSRENLKKYILAQ